jgi:hypothetical protein
VGLIGLPIACRNAEEPNKTAEAFKTPAPKDQAITNIPETPQKPISSPAIAMGAAIPVDLTPDEVCRRFLKCLQSAERTAAEQLLTKKALLNMKRADLNLESPGGRTAEFTVESPRYATNKQELATVDCIVLDVVDEKSVQSRLAWMLRHEPAGWRISGMILDMEDGKSLDLLSFENLDDIQRIKATLDSESNSALAELPRSSDTIRK